MFALPADLFATQAHGGAEGIVGHQLGHVFFLVSMGAFAYWLREGAILKDRAWNYIMCFAFLLVLWNLDVILLHYLDEQSDLIRTSKTGPWSIMVISRNDSPALALGYYLGKMDHLLCVPALFFLYLGLKRILGILESDQREKES